MTINRTSGTYMAIPKGQKNIEFTQKRRKEWDRLKMKIKTRSFLNWLKRNLQTQILGIYTKEIDIYALKKICTNIHSRFIYCSSKLERLSCILIRK